MQVLVYLLAFFLSVVCRFKYICIKYVYVNPNYLVGVTRRRRLGPFVCWVSEFPRTWTFGSAWKLLLYLSQSLSFSDEKKQIKCIRPLCLKSALPPPPANTISLIFIRFPAYFPEFSSGFSAKHPVQHTYCRIHAPATFFNSIWSCGFS